MAAFDRYQLDSPLYEHARTVCSIASLLIAFSGVCHADSVGSQRFVAAISRTSSLSQLKPQASNGEYLNEYKQRSVSDFQVNREIFDNSISDEMKARYNSYNKAYEAREPYRLNQAPEIIVQQQANKDLVEWTLRKLIQYHIETNLKNNVENSVKREANNSKSPEVRSAAKAIQTITTVHNAIKSTTFNFGSGTKTKFKYDFPSGTLKMGLVSPLVDMAVDYRLLPSPSTNPSNFGSVGVQQPEKLSLNVSRNLEFIKASTNFNYGLISSTMSYGVNKQLVGPLSAQVDRRIDKRNSARDETTVRLSFGTNF